MESPMAYKRKLPEPIDEGDETATEQRNTWTMQTLFPGTFEKFAAAAGPVAGLPTLDERTIIWDVAKTQYDHPFMALAELVDNAWDAGATKCEIKWDAPAPPASPSLRSAPPSPASQGSQMSQGSQDSSVPLEVLSRPRTLEIFDDGCGMTPEELYRALALGHKHRESKKPVRRHELIGRFGGGLKYGVAKLAGSMLIVTRSTKMPSLIAVGVFSLDLFRRSSSTPLLVWDATLNSWVQVTGDCHRFLDVHTVGSHIGSIFTDSFVRSCISKISSRNEGTLIALSSLNECIAGAGFTWSTHDIRDSNPPNAVLSNLSLYLSKIYLCDKDEHDPMEVTLSGQAVEANRLNECAWTDNGEYAKIEEINYQERTGLRRSLEVLIGWAVPSVLAPCLAAVHGMMWYHGKRGLELAKPFDKSRQVADKHKREAAGQGMVVVVRERFLLPSNNKCGYDVNSDEFKDAEDAVKERALKWAFAHRPADPARCRCEVCTSKREGFEFEWFPDSPNGRKQGEQKYKIALKAVASRRKTFEYSPSKDDEKRYFLQHPGKEQIGVSGQVHPLPFSSIEVKVTTKGKTTQISEKDVSSSKKAAKNAREDPLVTWRGQVTVTVPKDATSFSLQLREKNSTVPRKFYSLPIALDAPEIDALEIVDPGIINCDAQDLCLDITAKSSDNVLALGPDDAAYKLGVTLPGAAVQEMSLEISNSKFRLTVRVPLAEAKETHVNIVLLHNRYKASSLVTLRREHVVKKLAAKGVLPQELTNNDPIKCCIMARCKNDHDVLLLDKTLRVELRGAVGGVPVVTSDRKLGTPFSMPVRVEMNGPESVSAELYFQSAGLALSHPLVIRPNRNRYNAAVYRGGAISMIAGGEFCTQGFFVRNEAGDEKPLHELVQIVLSYHWHGPGGAVTTPSAAAVPKVSGEWLLQLFYERGRCPEPLTSVVGEESRTAFTVYVEAQAPSKLIADPASLDEASLPLTLSVHAVDVFNNCAQLPPGSVGRLLHGDQLLCQAEGSVLTFRLPSPLVGLPAHLTAEVYGLRVQIPVHQPAPTAVVTAATQAPTSTHLAARPVVKQRSAAHHARSEVKMVLAQKSQELAALPCGLQFKACLKEAPLPPQTSSIRLIDVIRVDTEQLARAMGECFHGDLSRYLARSIDEQDALMNSLPGHVSCFRLFDLNRQRRPQSEKVTRLVELVEADATVVAQHNISLDTINALIEECFGNFIVFVTNKEQEEWRAANLDSRRKRLCLLPKAMVLGGIVATKHERRSNETVWQPATKENQSSRLQKMYRDRSDKENEIEDLKRRLAALDECV